MTREYGKIEPDEDDVPTHREKFSHEEVNYSHGKPHAHCSLCEHYHGIDNCELVVSPIRPQMWCEEFEPK